MQGKHRAKLKINHSWCIKLTPTSVLSYSQTITAPWLYFAHDFLSNQRSNVRSRTNRIFSRVVYFVEEAGCFGLFLFVHVGWDIASREWLWMETRKEETPKLGFPSLADPYLAENLSGLKSFYPLCFIDRESLLFPFHFLFDLWSGILLSFLLFFSLFSSLFSFFLSFHFLLFFLFTFPSPSLSLGNQV